MLHTPSSDDDRPRLLVAEDEFPVAMELASLAQSDGWAVVGPVASLDTAMALESEGRVDAALLDYRLSDGSVEPLLHVLTRKLIPFVLVTAYDMSECFVVSRTATARVVRKPYRKHEVIELLHFLRGQRH